MSIPAFAWALEQGRAHGLSPAERLVLIYLADKANGIRVCWPGQETIKAYTGLALNTIVVAIRKLVARNLIRVDQSPGIATRYHILRDDTPANDEGVERPNGKVIHSPRKSEGGAHTNPRKSDGSYPLKSGGEPPNDLSQPPPNRCPEPYLTKKENLERGACAPEAQAQNLDSGGKEASKQAAPEASEPDDEARVPEEALIALRKQLGRTLRHEEFAPGRRPVRSVHEQIAAGEMPPLNAPLPPIHPAVAAAVWAARRDLAERAARLGRVAA